MYMRIKAFGVGRWVGGWFRRGNGIEIFFHYLFLFFWFVNITLLPRFSSLCGRSIFHFPLPLSMKLTPMPYRNVRGRQWPAVWRALFAHQLHLKGTCFFLSEKYIKILF